MTDLECIKKFEKWIWKCAHKYVGVSVYSDLDDLHSVGMMAALTGRDSFDPSRDATLATHIMNTIKFKILNEVNDTRNYSRSLGNGLLALNKAKKILGAAATSEEIYKWSKSYYSNPSSFLLPARQLDLERIESTQTDSLDALREREDVNPDKYTPREESTLEADLDLKMKYELLEEYTSRLSARDCRILKRRLANDTLDEIAKEVGVCKERIRQIEVSSIKKIISFHKQAKLNKLSFKKPKVAKKRVAKKRVATVAINYQGIYKGGGHMIYSKEYKLDPISFKVFQYLKNYQARNIETIKESLDLTNLQIHKAYDNLCRFNMVDIARVVQPPSDWRINTLKSISKIPPTVYSTRNPQLTPGVIINDGKYKITEVLPVGVEVEILASGKYTVLKPEEIEWMY